jgi:hypothetical protein
MVNALPRHKAIQKIFRLKSAISPTLLQHHPNHQTLKKMGHPACIIPNPSANRPEYLYREQFYRGTICWFIKP